MKIRVSAPPEHGKANQRIVRLLAGFLDLPESQIRIVSGQSTARKVVEITGGSIDVLREKIGGGGDYPSTK